MGTRAEPCYDILEPWSSGEAPPEPAPCEVMPQTHSFSSSTAALGQEGKSQDQERGYWRCPRPQLPPPLELEEVTHHTRTAPHQHSGPLGEVGAKLQAEG